MADVQPKQLIDKPLPRTAPAAPKAAPESAPGRYLNVTAGQLTQWIGFCRSNNTPHREMDGVITRPLTSQPAVSQAAVPKLEVKDLGKLGGAPEFDPADARPSFEQESGNLTTLATLLSALRPDLSKQLNTLIRQAAQEESLLGKGVA